MIRLESFQQGMRVRDLSSGQVKQVRLVSPHTEHTVEVIFKDTNGNLEEILLYREDENKFDELENDRWPFDADANLFKLVSEAYRIDLTSHALSPQAIHTSNVEIANKPTVQGSARSSAASTFCG